MTPLLTRSLPITTKRRLGFVKEAYSNHQPLDLANWEEFGYEKDDTEVRCVLPP